ncbi:lytic murein transglycosylase [Mycolicibacterium thermoresistibile]
MVRAAGVPVDALAGLVRIVVASAVVAAPSVIVGVLDEPAVRPVAAVTTQPALPTPVPSATTPARLPESVGPPPPAAVNEPGRLRIPPVALAAYRNADGMMARTHPHCHVSWNVLAGIGFIESRHAFDGAVDHRGTAVDPIFGPTLDGTLPGNEIIVASRADGRTTYARAMGPMQFLPTTWALYEADGDHDGRADPQNLFDATLAAARYLCSGGVDLRDRSALVGAVLRYNNSMAYTHNVLGWAQAYATGVPPGYLPPITAPVRPVPTRTVTATTSTPPAGEPFTGTLSAEPAESRNDRSAVRRNAGSSAPPSTPSTSTSSSTSSRSTGSGLSIGGSGSRSGSPTVKIGNGRTGGAR